MQSKRLERALEPSHADCSEENAEQVISVQSQSIGAFNEIERCRKPLDTEGLHVMKLLCSKYYQFEVFWVSLSRFSATVKRKDNAPLIWSYL